MKRFSPDQLRLTLILAAIAMGFIIYRFAVGY